MATYTVTTLSDEAIATGLPIDPTREAEDGTGLSLREAIELANALDGADEIIFHPDLANGRIALSGEALQITSDITIDGDAAGDGGGRIVLDGSFRSRVLEVDDGTSVISNVDVTRGGLADANAINVVGNGGGLLISEDANLTLDDARIYRNQSSDVGGSFGGGIFNAGTLQLTNSEVFDNVPVGVGRSSSSGGGIANTGTIVVENTRFSDNAVFGRFPGDGGGLVNSGTALLTNVLFTGNFSDVGAAISNTGNMVISGATITGNEGDGFFVAPNAVRNTGDLTVIQSTVTANDGAEIENRAELTLINSIVTEAPGWIVNKEGQNIVGTALFDGDLLVSRIRAEDIFATISPDGRPVLEDNGGTLQTIALRASELNLALDAGDRALAVDATGALLTSDGRGPGFTRNFDLSFVETAGAGAVDLGAFELRLDPVDSFIFNETVVPVLSYGGKQDQGTFSIGGFGTVLQQSENAWNHLLIDYEVTEDTVLTFRLFTGGEAEIYGIGFDNDDTPDSDTYFQLGGTQQGFGIQDFNVNAGASANTQFFRIPVGEYFTGDFDRLVFVTDKDTPGTGGQEPAASFWSGVRLFEDGPRVRLNGELEIIQSYGSRQDRGSVEIFDDGFTVVQDANSWKRLDIDYTVTENTVLSFDFAAFNEGELHAIGFDNDESPDSDTYFTLLGTQDGFGIRDFFDPSLLDGSPERIEIPVGEYFTGELDSLVLATDLDAGGLADSLWSNLTLFEIA
ncbi:right-handed parallel beta-helix repeat-containing protein [Cognatiyoonia sp. IB215446]|uniref:right-handed parallel beta-helix repeat-containing protein n=1 Tax=Cognatiyoonia sp. IB215446 TaxID=3097355 RepID=UPI002A0EB975|nr:right-handed parallel beta-helix repeat-containing protein [Cognatiyoonia sp. IB215446]MDX8347234.1 right-handed parallel beta-helix repeat-containing protein [Cognatiyoonia sp. IB215446]